MLGKGGEAIVTRAIDKKSGKFFALRNREKRSGERNFDFHVLSEILTLISLIELDCEHLLKISRLEYQTGVSFITLMEYGLGDLYSYLEFLNQNKTFLSLPQAESILIQVFHQSSIFREKRMYHRDIKPQNIIISEDFHFRLTDFGLLKQLNDKQTEFGKFPICGTRGYWCP